MARRLSSDEPFVSGLFAQLGSVATLPDNTTLRVILHSDASGFTDLCQNLYIDGEWMRYLKRETGTLAAEQVVVIDGVSYFVASISEVGRGWMVAALTRH